MSNNNERVYCERCPIIDVCWGKDNPDSKTIVTYEDDCVLAKLYNGELKVEIKTTGYVDKD